MSIFVEFNDIQKKKFSKLKKKKKKKKKKNCFKIKICVEFTNLVPESKSRICEGHELWNHEMWGPPVQDQKQ